MTTTLVPVMKVSLDKFYGKNTCMCVHDHDKHVNIKDFWSMFARQWDVQSEGRYTHNILPVVVFRNYNPVRRKLFF